MQPIRDVSDGPRLVCNVLKSDLQVQATIGCHRSEYDIHKHFLVAE